MESILLTNATEVSPAPLASSRLVIPYCGESLAPALYSSSTWAKFWAGIRPSTSPSVTRALMFLKSLLIISSTFLNCCLL